MNGEKIQVVNKPRPRINNADLVDVDEAEQVDLWRLRNELRCPCPKCPGDKWRFHDFYVEVHGGDVVTFKFFRVCRDCLYEEEVPLKNINEPAGEQKIRIFQNERPK